MKTSWLDTVTAVTSALRNDENLEVRDDRTLEQIAEQAISAARYVSRHSQDLQPEMHYVFLCIEMRNFLMKHEKHELASQMSGIKKATEDVAAKALHRRRNIAELFARVKETVEDGGRLNISKSETEVLRKVLNSILDRNREASAES